MKCIIQELTKLFQLMRIYIIMGMLLFLLLIIIVSIMIFDENITTYNNLLLAEKEEIVMVYGLNLNPNEDIEEFQFVHSFMYDFYVITISNVENIDSFLENNAHFHYSGNLKFAFRKTAKYKPKSYEHEYNVFLDGTTVYISSYGRNNRDIQEINRSLRDR